MSSSAAHKLALAAVSAPLKDHVKLIKVYRDELDAESVSLFDILDAMKRIDVTAQLLPAMLLLDAAMKKGWIVQQRNEACDAVKEIITRCDATSVKLAPEICTFTSHEMRNKTLFIHTLSLTLCVCVGNSFTVLQ